MIDDLILQVDGRHVIWVGHCYSKQDAHQQVDYLRRGRRREVKARTLSSSFVCLSTSATNCVSIWVHFMSAVQQN